MHKIERQLTVLAVVENPVYIEFFMSHGALDEFQHIIGSRAIKRGAGMFMTLAAIAHKLTTLIEGYEAFIDRESSEQHHVAR